MLSDMKLLPERREGSSETDLTMSEYSFACSSEWTLVAEVGSSPAGWPVVAAYSAAAR